MFFVIVFALALVRQDRSSDTNTPEHMRLFKKRMCDALTAESVAFGDVQLVLEDIKQLTSGTSFMKNFMSQDPCYDKYIDTLHHHREGGIWQPHYSFRPIEGFPPRYSMKKYLIGEHQSTVLHRALRYDGFKNHRIIHDDKENEDVGKIIKLILEYGADPKGGDPRDLATKAYTPLMEAVYFGYVAAAQALIDAGADMQLCGAPDADSVYCGQIACYAARGQPFAGVGGDLAMLQTLIKNGADLNVKCSGVRPKGRTKDGWTALDVLLDTMKDTRSMILKEKFPRATYEEGEEKKRKDLLDEPGKCSRAIKDLLEGEEKKRAAAAEETVP